MLEDKFVVQRVERNVAGYDFAFLSGNYVIPVPSAYGHNICEGCNVMFDAKKVEFHNPETDAVVYSQGL